MVETGAPESNDLLLLTTVDVPCAPFDFETRDVPLELAAGVCRDDAQVVVLRLVRDPDAAAAGRYAVIEDPSQVDEPFDWTATLHDDPRVAWGRHLSVDEVSMSLDDGLGAPRMVIGRLTDHPDLDKHGEVRLDTADADTLRGTFSFPAQHVSGRFTARSCPVEDSWAFTLVEGIPAGIQPPFECPLTF